MALGSRHHGVAGLATSPWLAAFMAETSTDESDALVEFLAGVMHWCDRSGESFEAQLERARSVHREETNAAELADTIAS